MQLSEDKLILSATDLSDFLACDHLSLLSRLAALGGPEPPRFDDPGLEVLWELGRVHEEAYLADLEAQGLSVVEIPQRATETETAGADGWHAGAEATREAMRQGVDVVYQGVLFDGRWLGKPDFLRRVDHPSALGDFSYEVVDTKLAREAKAGAVLQIAVYSDLLADVQGRAPEKMYLALGGPDNRVEAFYFADFAAYLRFVRDRFQRALEDASDEPPYAPDPCDHCAICAWQTRCDKERRDVDHLSLVAGISRKQTKALEEREVFTLEALAGLTLPVELEGVSRPAAERIREQARIQVEGRRAGEPRYELLEPVVPEEGLAALPAPSPGDVFFDIEGDPHFEDFGLEYLLGWIDQDEKCQEYRALWALDRQTEKRQFEAFIDHVTERLDQFPDLHVYHYAPYEPTALKRLAGRHGTREDALDRLLRGGVFVDLYRVVRQGLRASVESYSIKKMEPFYGFERDVDLRRASSALAHFEAWLALGRSGKEAPGLLEEIEGYNRDDCLSTLKLRDWLERLRDELQQRIGHQVPRPEPRDPEPSEEASEAQQLVAELAEALTRDVPADPSKATARQRARWLLAQLLDWHRREKKSTWWQYFAWLELTHEELIEDRSTLGGLAYEGIVDEIKRSYVHRYRFPRQEHDLKLRDTPRDPETGSSAGEVVAVDDLAGTIDLKRGKTSGVPHPRALIPLDDVADKTLRESILRTAECTLEHGLEEASPHRAVADLLLREPPRVGQEPGTPLVRDGEDVLGTAKRLVAALDRSVLPIQGPPGAGKTYTGARLILDRLQAGKRVGVTATSHRVISNLLDEVCRAAVEEGVTVRGIQKPREGEGCDSDAIAITTSNEEVRKALASGRVGLAAGTAWLWSRKEMAGSVDVLFVDEAGQFSLANAVAVAPAAESLVLLGDPRQLEQPTRGVHPPGADVSVLDHLLAGEPTVSPERGIFLPETWRLHPRLAEFTSEVFYRSRLRSRSGLERQVLTGDGPVGGAGLRFLPVEHEGNQSESSEEVEAVARLVEEVLSASLEWTHRSDGTGPLGAQDILVVAPYNAQVNALREALPGDVRVGTVDKFQGQEGAVVLYSLTTSSPEDAPRGMSFLYNPNRLNVATSRARCLAVLVGSPRLFAPECRSPLQMRLANAFCRLAELAEEVACRGNAGDQ